VNVPVVVMSRNGEEEANDIEKNNDSGEGDNVY
jgi:hypothetical protein